MRIIVALGLLVAACKEPRPAGDAIKKMTQLRDRYCACPDTACTRQVATEINAYMEDKAKAPNLTADEAKQVDAMHDELRTCDARLRAGHAP